jgi:hemoglobin/transferrin/lactoferrin receptor protein
MPVQSSTHLAARCLLPLCLLTPARALDPLPPAPTPLPPVVVTGTRLPEPAATVPGTVVALPATLIAGRLDRTLPEALGEIPGVLVQRTSNGQASPFIRGFTGYRTLALIDGVRLNNAAFRSGPNQYWGTIDPYSLDSAELLLGPASVLYGSDAVGGTLNALVRRPRYAETGSHREGLAALRASSAETSLTGRLQADLSEAGRWGLTLGATFRDYDDLRAAGLGSQPKTGYQEWALDGTFEWLAGPETKITIHHDQVHQDDAWRSHATIYGVSWQGTTVGSDLRRSLDQDRWLTFARWETTAPSAWFDTARVTISHHRQAEDQQRIRSNRAADYQGFTVNSWGLAVQFTNENPLGELAWGADYTLDLIDSSRDDFNPDGSLKAKRIQGPVADDSRYHLAGVFAEQRLDAAERLKLWLGLRATYAAADAGRYEDPLTSAPASLEDSWTNLAASLRGAWDPAGDDSLVLTAGLSPAFRAPSLSDLTALNNARSGEIETPSPGLDPEQFLTAEVGLRAKLGPFAPSLTYYHTWLDQLVVNRRTGRMIDDLAEVTAVNSGRGNLDGIEARVEWLPDDHWRAHLACAWQEGNVHTYPSAEAPLTREPISRLAPFTIQAGLRYQTDEGRWWIEALATHAEAQNRLSASDRNDTQRIPPGGTPGYTVGTLRGGWRVFDGFTLTAAVENLWDEEYRHHGSGLNEAGINFIVGAEWRF